MLIVADTHVHVYPYYDMVRALPRASAALDAYAGGREHVNVLCLAERTNDHWFADVRSGTVDPPEGFSVESPGNDANAILLQSSESQPVYIVAGRQIVTRERIEVLSLASDSPIPDGGSAPDTVRAALDGGGVPVLSWAPGKWLGARGKTIRELIAGATPGCLLVGDTAIRPALSCLPSPMRLAVSRGLTVVAGSDPLPFAGEELYIGTYASQWESTFDPSAPARSIASALLTTEVMSKSVGRRCGWCRSLYRTAQCFLPRR